MLLAITITAVIVGSYLFSATVGAVFAGVYREWETMVTRKPLSIVGMGLIGLVALASLLFPLLGVPGVAGVIAIAAVIALLARGGEIAIWRFFGLLFFGLVMVAILVMRDATTLGIYACIFVGTVVWGTDSAAFFAGRQMGGEKLAPAISPSKTWSGALGGLALGTIMGSVIWVWFTDSPLWIGVVIAALTSILSQTGDLTESAIKRHFRIKDSGDIIPGHGGLMDRLDSLTFGVLFAVAVGIVHAGTNAVATGLLVW